MKAITVKQPLADNIQNGSSRVILIEKPTDYRGNVIVASDKIPFHRYKKNYPSERLGKSICAVEVIDCVKVSDLSMEEWVKFSGLVRSEKSFFRRAYVLIVLHIAKVETYDIEPKAGIFDIKVPDTIFRNIRDFEDSEDDKGDKLAKIVSYAIMIAVICGTCGVVKWLFF